MLFSKPGFSDCVIQLFDIKDSNVCDDHSYDLYQEEKSAIFEFENEVERYETEEI